MRCRPAKKPGNGLSWAGSPGVEPSGSAEKLQGLEEKASDPRKPYLLRASYSFHSLSRAEMSILAYGPKCDPLFRQASTVPEAYECFTGDAFIPSSPACDHVGSCPNWPKSDRNRSAFGMERTAVQGLATFIFPSNLKAFLMALLSLWTITCTSTFTWNILFNFTYYEWCSVGLKWISEFFIKNS